MWLPHVVRGSPHAHVLHAVPDRHDVEQAVKFLLPLPGLRKDDTGNPFYQDTLPDQLRIKGYIGAVSSGYLLRTLALALWNDSRRTIP